MHILGNTAHVTTKSSQHCLLNVQKGKHLLRKQNVSENVSRKMFPQQMFRSRANRETFRETCFLNNVSATMFPQQCFLVCRGLYSIHAKHYQIALTK